MMSKGDTLLSKGNKILEKTTLFGFGKIKKYEDAIELFTKAGYAFKIENDLESAGNAFLKASKYIKQIPDDMNYSYMNTLINAANCFKKINSVKAIKILNRIVDINNEDGRFAASAKYYQEMGEIYESRSAYRSRSNRCQNPRSSRGYHLRVGDPPSVWHHHDSHSSRRWQGWKIFGPGREPRRGSAIASDSNRYRNGYQSGSHVGIERR